MGTTTIRQQLHEYIDTAEDKKIEAIFTLLETEIIQSHAYTPEELKKFYDRRENYMNGSIQTHTAKETHDYIREKHKKG